MAKKVLHIFGQMERGGAELRTLATMPYLQKAQVNYEFCVLSGKQGVLDNDIRTQGGEVHYCPLGLLFPLHFIRLLKKEKIDIVHSHVAMVSGFILLLARIAGVKQRIAHFRNTHDTAHNSLARKLRNRLLHKFIDLFATNILGVCKAALKVFWSADWQADKRCQAIYNGLPQVNYQVKAQDFWQPFFTTKQAAKSPSIQAPIFINVARMAEQKNHLFMVEVIAAYQAKYGDTTLVFIGKEDRQIKQALVDKAVALNCQHCLYFAGEQSDVYPFMHNSDAMLFPSKWEGLPGAVIEAASIGLPVIATDLPGVVEIAEYLPAVKPVSLTQSADYWADILAQSQQQAAQRSAQAHAFTESPFSIHQCAQALLNVYQ